MLCKAGLLFAVVALSAFPQQLQITGAPDRTITIGVAEFAKMPHTTITVTEHGKEHTYEGVLLRDLLKQAGAPMGDQFRGRFVPAYVYVSAKDGYHTTLALAEIEPAFQDHQILVADTEDRKPLSPEQGPFHLVVPEDKKAARSVRMVERIEVRLPEAN